MITYALYTWLRKMHHSGIGQLMDMVCNRTCNQPAGRKLLVDVETGIPDLAKMYF